MEQQPLTIQSLVGQFMLVYCFATRLHRPLSRSSCHGASKGVTSIDDSGTAEAGNPETAEWKAALAFDILLLSSREPSATCGELLEEWLSWFSATSGKHCGRLSQVVHESHPQPGEERGLLLLLLAPSSPKTSTKTSVVLVLNLSAFHVVIMKISRRTCPPCRAP